MKKLTSGMFAVLLGLVAADANANIASQAYVDEQVTGVTTNVSNLTTRMDTAESDIDALEGKVGDTSVAEQIADTIKNYTNTTDMNAKLDLKADKSTIGTVPENKTVVQMIEDATSGSTEVTDALAERVGTLETDNTTNKSDIAAIKTEQGTQNTNITNLQTNKLDTSTTTVTDANYIKNANTVAGNLTALDTAVKTNADAIADNADAISGLQAGTGLGEGAVTTDKIADKNVTEGKLDDALATKINGKQDKSTADYAMGNKDGTWTAMTADQIAALDSKVTAATVTQVATNTSDIATNKSEFDAFKKAIETTSTAGDGKYVLTVNEVNGARTYNWEQIQRGASETTPGA